MTKNALPTTISPVYPQGTDPETWKSTEVGGGDISEFQLAVGHYMTEKYGMVVVSPRPDAETGDFASTTARHRWAYYDGVNDVRYEYPIKIYGGSAPHIFQVINGPAWLTVGNDRTAANHGVLKGVPTQAYSTENPASVTVRVYGQDGTTIDLSCTIATTASTTKFMFLSNSGNDITGDGSISAPFATLPKMMGVSSITATYPNRIVYMRGGDYATVAHTDAWNGGNAGEIIDSRIQLVKANHPVCYIAYPDEDVNIDFSDAQILTGGPDFALMGSSASRMTIQGSADNAAETHNIWITEVARGVIAWVTFDGFVPREAANWTNSAPMFSPGGTGSNRRYWGFHDVQEINRTVQSANDGSLHVYFSTEYWVEDFCGHNRLSSGRGAGYKDTNFYTSVRYGNYYTIGDSESGFAFMCQNGSGDNEICYSKVKGPLWFNFQFTESTTDHHAARCTVYTTDSNYNQALRSWNGAVGPFTAENCVLVSNGSPQCHPAITSTGNECHATVGGGNVPVNTTTLNLVDAGTAYRTLYLGTRGAEIA